MTDNVACILNYLIVSSTACAKNITLEQPQSKILGQIGEELRITCLGTKCQNPKFTWSSLTDAPLGATIHNDEQISVLTMKIIRENLHLYEPYRCTVRCDNPPAEKGFKVIVYCKCYNTVSNTSLM